MASVIGHAVALAMQLAPAEPDALPPASTGYGVQLVRTVLSLLGVCVAAWVVLRWAAQRGLGQGGLGRNARNVRVLERVMLEPRRSLFLVEVGTRVLLLGGAEGGLSLIAELKPEELTARANAPGTNAVLPAGVRFADILARVKRSGAPDAGTEAPPGTGGAS